ncbi:amidohydrolase family protein [Leifsonia xyli]|uniref:amidohydrolase family protein n=1 Tax=Leifsonia xyli TaxID=1575 RepID=UPI003D6659F2
MPTGFRTVPRRRQTPASARLPIDLLLKGYTIDAARQLRIDDKVGSLEVGKLANLVVLGGDPVRAGASSVADIPVQAVFFEGAMVAGSIPGATPASAHGKATVLP